MIILNCFMGECWCISVWFLLKWAYGEY